MKKYYTPEIEEFHQGFEYEIKHLDGKSFVGGPKIFKKEYTKEVYMLEDFIDVFVGLDNNNTRVKYLDREDVESFGFDMKTTSYGNYYSNNNYTIKYAWDKRLIISEIDKLRTPDIDGNFKENIIFLGEIRNKSELKRLLTQLKITK